MGVASSLMLFCALSDQAPKGKVVSKSKKFELTEEQKQEIREAFDLFDTDGSGILCSIADTCHRPAFVPEGVTNSNFSPYLQL